MRYVSYQRPTPQGTTDYLSLTIAANTSPVEFDEFTLDDEARPHWEGFLKHSCLLAVGDLEVAEQLVAWRRRWVRGWWKGLGCWVGGNGWTACGGDGMEEVEGGGRGGAGGISEAQLPAGRGNLAVAEQLVAWRRRWVGGVAWVDGGGAVERGNGGAQDEVVMAWREVKGVGECGTAFKHSVLLALEDLDVAEQLVAWRRRWVGFRCWVGDGGGRAGLAGGDYGICTMWCTLLLLYFSSSTGHSSVQHLVQML